jgi:uncharacterized protein YqhQ
MENETGPSEEAATAPTNAQSSSQEAQQQKIIIILVISAILFLALIIASIVVLLLPATDTAKVRDVFIIFMALESLFLGLTMVILIIQLARLINLLQNEIGPILESTNETVNTLRGTSEFLSDNLVEPVIKMNERAAGVNQALKIIGLVRGTKPKKSNSPGE